MLEIKQEFNQSKTMGIALFKPARDNPLTAVVHQVHGRSDEITAGHLKRMGQYAILISEQLGLDEDLQKQIYYAGMLHDIGKLAMPQGILEKPGYYSSGEKEIMNNHTLIGAEMLNKYRLPCLNMAAEVALYHHECWNGNGYPYGLSGEAIPLSARIVAICDVYDALRSDRPYKDAFSHQAALTTMQNGDGRTMPEHFDPSVLAAFLRINLRFDEVYSGSLNA